MKRPQKPAHDDVQQAAGSMAAQASQSDAWGQPAQSRGEQDPLTIAESERYERLLELGRGGMGRVMSARDRRLGRLVALKEVLAGTEQRTAAARLIAEAQLAAGLDHPSILAVHDAGRDANGHPFYAMRLVRGQTLTDAAAALPSLVERLRLLRPLLAACQAVAHAHERNIVHRDLKPDNILVGAHGETQVADWGLACTVADAERGGVIGTPGYMAPEVAVGRPASPRSDVFSMGATLVVVLHAAVPDTDLARRAAELPPELRAIAERCLKPDPQQRYADAGALVDDLAAWLDGRRVAAYSYSVADLLLRLWRTFRGLIVVGGIGLLVVMVVAWQGYRRTVEQRDRAVIAESLARHSQAQSEKNLGAAYAQAAESAAINGARPEAETLAAAAIARGDSATARGILAQLADGPEVTLDLDVALPACQRLRFSPDGRWLLCINDVEAVLLRTDDGRPLWRKAGAFFDGAISSRASRVLLSRRWHEGEIFDLMSGAPVSSSLVLHVVEPLLAQRETSWVAVAFTQSVMLIDLATQRTHTFETCSHNDKIAAAAFAPEPATLLVSCFSGRISRVTVQAVELLDSGVLLKSPGGASALDVLSDGTIMLGTTDGHLWAGGRELPHWAGSSYRVQPSVQSLWTGPDGSVAVAGEGLGPIVWLQLLQAPVRLPVRDRQALAFIDGHKVAVAGERLTRYTLRPPARGVHFTTSAGLSQVALSPDGKWLASGGGDGMLSVFDTRSKELVLHRQMTAAVVTSVAFSPDGQRLAVGMGGAPGQALLRTGSWESLPVDAPTPIKRLGYFTNGVLWRSTYRAGIDFVDAQGRLRAADDLRTKAGPVAVADNATKTAFVQYTGLGDILLFRQSDPLRPDVLMNAPSVTAVAASSSEQLVAIADASRVRIFEVTNRRFLRELAGSVERTVHIAFSPDDRLLFTADLERTVRVWQVADGREIAVLRGHSQRVSSLVFGADPTQLYSASWDGSIRRWDLGALLTPAEKLPAAIASRWSIDLKDTLRTHLR